MDIATEPPPQTLPAVTLPQIQPADAPILEKYFIVREVGRGAFSVVWEAYHKSTNQRYAIKSINKKYISKQGWINLCREVEIMIHLNHPNILRLHEYINTATHVHLILDYVDGGELFDQIVQRGNFGEKDASAIVKQILSGIHYLHTNGVAHRDLKPENLLCCSDGRVVVADFGLAKVFGRGELLRTHCGTPTYAAPEIVRGDKAYSNAVDMWSIGVITYILLCGFFPFFSEDSEILRTKIISAEYSFPSPYWDNISEEAKDFIKHLLVVDPAKRLTAEQAFKHPFMEGKSLHNKLNLRTSMENFNVKRRQDRDPNGMVVDS